MMKRHEIQVLLRAGLSQAKVADLAGVAERTVRTVAGEEPVVEIAEAAERARRGIGRPSLAEPYRDFVRGVLEQEPDLLSLEILRRARLRGYEGGKSAMYELVAALRPTVTRPLVRFEGLAGEFTQHDFGHVDVRFMNGTTSRRHFFASRLKYSRFVAVTLVPNEQAETLVRTLVEHFEALGGVPLLAVFDRPKTIAIEWARNGDVTKWNSTFIDVMVELGVAAEVCWPGRGNQKGSVENLVGWVKGSFFKQRRFQDDADLVNQLAEWHEEVNTRRPCRATGIIPAERRREEMPRLRPLKVAPQDLALRIPVFVGPTAMVLHDTHLYSMPGEAIGISATLFLYRDRVRICAGRHSADHPRLFVRGAKSILPEHRTEHVKAVSGKRARRYLKREHLLGVGESAHLYLTEVVHRRPRAWTSEVDALHELLQKHGEAALARAFERALDAHTYGTEYVAHYLEHAGRQQEMFQ